MNRTSLMGAGAAALACLTLAACGVKKDKESEPAAASTAPAVTTEQQGAGETGAPRLAGTPESWVAWDSASCSFKPASDHPTEWDPAAAADANGLKVAYTPETTELPFDVKQNRGVEAVAGRAGVELKTFDNQYPSTSQPINVAKAVAQFKPDAVLSMNVIANLYPQIMKIYDRACLPTIVLDLSPPDNSVFFGVRQGDMGTVASEYAATVMRERGWDLGATYVVSCSDSDVGTDPGSPFDRVDYFHRGIRAAFPEIPADNYTMLNCHTQQGSEQSRQQMADWLTAHPQAKHVVGNAINDMRALGMHTALKAKGMGENAALVGIDADPPNLKLIEDGDPIFVGDVTQYPERRGELLIPLAKDVADGKPVPEEVYMAPGVIHG